MYRCDDCGCLFGYPERFADRVDDLPGAETSCRCPECGTTNFYKVEPCKLCGEYHDPYEMYSGVCEHCLIEAATMENLREYVFSVPTVLADFVFCEVLGTGLDCYEITEKITDFAKHAFDYLLAQDEFNLAVLSDYILCGQIEREDFATFIEGRDG